MLGKIQQRDEKFHEKGHVVARANPRCLRSQGKLIETKRPPAESWWVQKLSADFTAD